MNILFLLRPKVTVAFLYHDNTLRQGLEKMRAHGYTALPVIERDGTYAGTVNEGDFLWHMVDHGNADMKAQEACFVRLEPGGHRERYDGRAAAAGDGAELCTGGGRPASVCRHHHPKRCHPLFL